MISVRQLVIILPIAFATSVFAEPLRAPAPIDPVPFPPLRTSRAGFQIGTREVSLGAMLLPKRIQFQNEDLLSSAIALRSSPEYLSRLSGQTTAFQKSATNATWTWNGESLDLRATATMNVDRDGLQTYDITLIPKRPLQLQSLELRIPRTQSTSRYLHTSDYSWSNVSKGLAELGGNWDASFVPYVWLGNEDSGLAWCAESPRALGAESWDGQKISVQTARDEVLFTVRIGCATNAWSEPIKLRFGLQSSPVKPVSFGWRSQARILHDIHYDSCEPGTNGVCELDRIRDGGAKTVVIHDSWTAYFGQMTPADPAGFRRLIAACHERGLRLLVYVGYGLARAAPELQGKHDLWSAVPLIPWVPSFKPETRAFDATCANSPWADWLVEQTDRLFSLYELDGLYFDGTSEAWKCQNESHGCSWRDRAGVLHPSYPIFAARNLMQRIAAAVRKHNPHAILDAHMSSNLTLPTLSCCDSLWNGEQFEGHTAAEHFTVPLPAFRTEFMGYAHGLDIEFLCYEKRPFTFPEAIALAWVHGVEVRPYPANLHFVTPIWKALDELQITHANWRPYWKDPIATSDCAAVKVSGWTRRNDALLVVSHLARTNESASIRLDKAFRRARHVTDALSGEALSPEGDVLRLSFDGMTCRFLRLRQ